jgi:catalase
LPLVARFSLFAGLPDLADNDDAASPAGFAIKIKGRDGQDFDVEANQHKDFITATTDEFAVFLRALPVSGPDAPHPTAVEQFLASHPHAAEFLASRTYPASYAEATYFGVNALKFTAANGAARFVRTASRLEPASAISRPRSVRRATPATCRMRSPAG